MRATRLLWIDLCTHPSRSARLAAVATGYAVQRITAQESAVRIARTFLPKVACLDFDYPDRTRLKLVSLLRQEIPMLPLLMLTEYHSEALAVWAFRSGVWDYRVKPVAPDVLRRSIDVAAGGATAASAGRTAVRALPLDLVEPAGHLKRAPSFARRTGAAVAYITQHFDEPLTREMLSRICLLSQSQFSRDFKREHGATYSRFLLEYRIAKARDLLAEPEATVSQAAYASGFNDASYFGRVFRKLVGITAARYQRQTRSQPVAGTPAHISPRRAEDSAGE